MIGVSIDGELAWSITLPVELLNRNDGRGHAHWRSTAEKKRLANLLPLLARREPFGVPVFLVVTRILGKGQRLWDEDSILRGSAKELIDAMVGAKWLHDDSPKWVCGVLGRQCARNRPDHPAVRVDFFVAKS
jgi:hypothetical protein